MSGQTGDNGGQSTPEATTVPKIGWCDIYKMLWKCRDLEISTLWQRSVMLGTFMAITYTGYGMLMLNAFEHGVSQKWVLFNLLSIALCCFGMIFSSLWIMMMKGSKADFERCESAINVFPKVAPSSTFEVGVQGHSGHKMFWTQETDEDYKAQSKPSDHLFSTSAGAFSVSRVAIAIGQISIVGWGLLAVFHAFALQLEAFTFPVFKEAFVRFSGGVLPFVCIALICWLKHCLHSKM